MEKIIKQKVLILLFFIFIAGCKDENENKIFYKALVNLENKMSEQQLEEYSKVKEGGPFYDRRYNYLRNYNDQIFSNKTDTSLKVFFRNKGISNINDMSDIFFISLHRKINDRDINLEKQIKIKVDRYKKFDECEKLQDRTLIKNDKFIVGDSVQVRMRINRRDNRAYTIDCLNMATDWTFDDEKDLLIKGIVLGKYTYANNPGYVYMNIEIFSINKDNIPTPVTIPKKGSKFSVVLNYDVIELYSPLR